MECFDVVLALQSGWFNILIYIKDEICCMGTCTPCYVFITLFLQVISLHQYYQSQPYQNNYIQEALDDSNMRQQCPEVKMWDKPPIEEDAPMGTSLRRSS